MSANLTIGGFVVIFSLFFLYFSIQLPPGRSPASLGPGAWPTAVLVIMLIMGVLLIIRTIGQMRMQKDKPLTGGEGSVTLGAEKTGTKIGLAGEETEPSQEGGLRYRHWLVAAMFSAYVLIMNYLGFFVSTFLFLMVSCWVLGLRRWITLTLTSLVSALLIVYLFNSILSVPLPHGVGVFRTISLLIG